MASTRLDIEPGAVHTGSGRFDIADKKANDAYVAGLVPKAASNAVESGASVEQINAAAREEIIKPQEVAAGEHVPFGQEFDETDEYSNPFTLSPQELKGNRKKVNAIRSATVAISNGQDPVQAFQSAEQEDVEAYDFDTTQFALSQERQDVVDATEALIIEGVGGEDALSTAQAGNEVLEGVDQKFSSVLAAEYAFISQTNAALMDEAEQKEFAVQLYIGRKIAEIADKAGISDYAGLFLLPDESINEGAFLNEVLGGSSKWSNFANNAEVLGRLGSSFKLLEPEEKKIAFDQFEKAVQGMDDNHIQQLLTLFKAVGLEDTDEFWSAVDKADLALTVTAVGGLPFKMLKFYRGFNSLRMAAKAGEIDAAANIANIAAGSSEGAKVVGVSRLDAASSQTPFSTVLNDTLLEGVAPGISSQIKDVVKRTEARIDEASKTIKEGLHLEDAERMAAVTRREDILKADPRFENVSGEITSEGKMSFNFDVVDGTSNKKVTSFNMDYDVDDITGGFLTNQLTFVGDLIRGVASPNFLLGADSRLFVNKFHSLILAGSKIKRGFSEAQHTALKGLGKQDIIQVQNLLRKGADKEEVFSYSRLEGMGVSDKVKSAYYANRLLVDKAWSWKNSEIRASKIALGEKHVRVGDDFVYAKPLDNAAKASATFRADVKSPLIHVESPVDGGVSRMLGTDEVGEGVLKDYYDKGYVLVKASEKAGFQLNGKAAKYSLVKRDRIGELPGEVLNRVPGYLPQVYKNSHFFVKLRKDLDVGLDKPQSAFSTLRYFDNETDAKKFAEGYANKNGVALEDVVVRGDREVLPSDLEDDIVNLFGGLYKGARKGERLKFGLDGQEAALVDPLEAMQNYFNHLGNSMPMSVYRMGLERRWNNAAEEFLGGQRMVGGFQDRRGAIENHTAGNSLERGKLLKAHDQIMAMARIPSTTERIIQDKVRSFGKYLETKNLKGAAKWMYRLDHSSIPDAIKGASFNLFLGVFSPVQAVVQALGASVALSINPVYAAKGAGKVVAFSLLDNIKNPAARAGAIKQLSKIEGVNVKDLEETYALWQKSGMHDSVVSTNADFYTMANGLPYDASLVRRLTSKHLMFFKMGELTNMRISFVTALERWKDLNKGAKVDDNALREILKRAEDFRLNMSQANKATFQKGFMGIPTQFQQVNTKFVEAIVGNDFTKGEKMRLFLGQAGIYGTAGIPVLDALTDFTISQFWEPGDLDSEELTLAKRGITGWYLNDVMDVDAVITGRVALAGGFTQNLIDMFTEEAELSAAALGPFGSIVDRSWDSVQQFMMAGKYVVSADDITLPQAGMLAEALATSIAQVPSSTRNLVKAYDMQNGYMRKSNGQILYQIQPEFRDVVSQGFGLASQDAADLWDAEKLDMARKKSENLYVDRVLRLTVSMTRFMDENNPEQVRAHQMAISQLMQDISDPNTRQRLNDQLTRKMGSGSGVLEKKIQNFLKDKQGDFAKAGSSFNILMQKKVEGQ